MDTTVTLDGHDFQVETATTDAERAHGLMDRTHLAADHGMLFVFATETPQSFWMKDTLIPLDILYFDADRQLVSMQLNAQPCHQHPCPIYPSGAAAQYVLELPAGTAARIGASKGDAMMVDPEIPTADP